MLNSFHYSIVTFKMKASLINDSTSTIAFANSLNKDFLGKWEI